MIPNVLNHTHDRMVVPSIMLSGDGNVTTDPPAARPGPHRNFPSRHKGTLLLVPVGDVAAGPPPVALVACLRAHFCMPVELALGRLSGLSAP